MLCKYPYGDVDPVTCMPSSRPHWAIELLRAARLASALTTDATRSLVSGQSTQPLQHRAVCDGRRAAVGEQGLEQMLKATIDVAVVRTAGEAARTWHQTSFVRDQHRLLTPNSKGLSALLLPLPMPMPMPMHSTSGTCSAYSVFLS